MISAGGVPAEFLLDLRPGMRTSSGLNEMSVLLCSCTVGRVGKERKVSERTWHTFRY